MEEDGEEEVGDDDIMILHGFAEYGSFNERSGGGQRTQKEGSGW